MKMTEILYTHSDSYDVAHGKLKPHQVLNSKEQKWKEKKIKFTVQCQPDIKLAQQSLWWPRESQMCHDVFEASRKQVVQVGRPPEDRAPEVREPPGVVQGSRRVEYKRTFLGKEGCNGVDQAYPGTYVYPIFPPQPKCSISGFLDLCQQISWIDPDLSRPIDQDVASLRVKGKKYCIPLPWGDLQSLPYVCWL